ncbi:RsiV family protein [uncultured Acinetobacter sp.]|uniref:RsiV family protein n=1 Tax=uncultured Acinetobacter sp. TaxID=165433 RepID=UPI002630BF2F|nr:RsiV family protein [uncultured Acinetobacter sp.]
MQKVAVWMMMGLTVLLTACQPKHAPHPSDPKPEAAKVVLLSSQSIQMNLPRAEVCESEGCERYNLHTVHTNLPWIDAYFVKRLTQLAPKAFDIAQQRIVPDLNEPASLAHHQHFVSYIAQRNQLALFTLQSNSSGTHLPHSLLHQEYVNLDLNLQQRLALSDVLQKNQQAALLSLLYRHNEAWLKVRQIEAEQLKLSDNFYFAAQGFTLVYPVFELGNYSEGMTELHIPYSALSDIIKPEYLPSLPSDMKP